MARSSEYGDLTWVRPASWTDANRKSVQLIVIHTTEGSARGESAEDGAAYDARRTDGTSTHYFHDSNSTIQCVRTEDQAHAARAQGNKRGIQHELCTRAGSADWNDTYHQAMLKRAAKQAARDAKKWGIPVRHLTVSEVEDGAKGFCGHVDITYAFPADKGTHTDPGKSFPWTQFLNYVRAEMAPKETPVGNVNNFDDLVKQTSFATGGGTHSPVGDGVLNSSYPARDGATRTPAWSNLQGLQEALDEQGSRLSEVVASLADVKAQLDRIEALLTADTDQPFGAYGHPGKPADPV